MRRRIILFSLIGILSLGGAAYLANDTQKTYYTPRTVESSYDGYRDAMEYVRQLRANPQTGKVETADVLEARRELAALRKQQKGKKGALDLQWDVAGPTNVGGRTRSILVDKDNSQIMYAGSVSGGLFKSTNGGRSWNPVTTPSENLSVTDITQASNGDIYFSTGEAMYIGLGNFSGSPAFLGGGIFKSTDGGNTFTSLPSTAPSVTNPRFDDWASIGKLAVDPNDVNTLYAATAGGLKKSTDGGQTWTDPIGVNSTSTDLTVTKSGTVWVKVSNQIFKSTDGINFNEITCVGFNCTPIPRNGSRMRIAVSPQDEDYVYVIATSGGQFDKAYRSTDGGATFTVIGQVSSLINPHSGQGTWNNALAVDPKNKDRIVVGGVTLWEWSLQNGWQRIALLFRQATPFYVHADNHEVTFDTATGRMFVGNDGGIFKSNDGGQTFSEENSGYSTAQFFAFDIGSKGELQGGTQDNGVLFIDPNSFLPKNGERTVGVATATGGLFNGDGGFAALSRLNPNVRFQEMQFARMGRSIDKGASYSDIFDTRMHPNVINVGETYGTGIIAPFIAPFLLHEDINDPTSTDSVALTAKNAFVSLGFGNNSKTYNGSLTRVRSQARFIADSFVAKAGDQVVRSDASGNLSGDGTGTFDIQTGAFSVEFNEGTNREVTAQTDIMYPQGAVIDLQSAINDLPVRVTLQSDIKPRETRKFQDPIQSVFVMGLRSSDLFSVQQRPLPPFTQFDRNEVGGIWMTRGALSNLNFDPKWWHIGKLGNGVSPSALTMSADGDVLYVGASNGNVYRFSNLNNARDSASASVDDRYVSIDSVVPNQSVIQRKFIGNFGAYVGGLSFDETDKNRLIVCLAGYGGSQSKVFYTENATSPSLNSTQFVDVGGNLPEMPVLEAVFNFNDPTGGEVILGTDQGIFTTADIRANPVTWTQEVNGMANVPVFDLQQDRILEEGKVVLGGAVYAATHGRGIFKTSSTEDFYRVGNPENTMEPLTREPNPAFYPNPVENNLNIEINLENRTNVNIKVYSISGTLIKEIVRENVPASAQKVDFTLEELKPGAYIVSASYENKVISGKVIKR